MSGSRMSHQLRGTRARGVLHLPVGGGMGGGGSGENASTTSGASGPGRSTSGPWNGPRPGDWVIRSDGSPQAALPGFCSARMLADRSGLIYDDTRPQGNVPQPPEEGTTNLSSALNNVSVDTAASTSGEQQSPGVVNRSLRTVKGLDLSPGFQSAVALAGWDFESLFLATLQEGDQGNRAITPARNSEPPLQRTPDPGRVDDVDMPTCRCGLCASCFDRKRVQRTPGHAITPASANRRHRRYRTQIFDHSPLDFPPIGRLNLSQEPALEDGITVLEAEKDQNFTRGSRPLQVEGDPGSVQGEVLHREDSVEGNEDTGRCDYAKSSEESKIPSLGQLPCMDQLRDELSCAVCLEICIEPTTTSCGHSFCRTCLKSAIERCGSRCPKCRQFLRGEVKCCPLNTTLWNTIQLLFPTETSARLLERSSTLTEAASLTARIQDAAVPTASEYFLSTAVSRAVRTGPWRNQTPPLRPPPPPPPSFLPPLTPTSLSPPDSSAGPMRYYFSLRRNTRSSTRMQEQEDFLLARRLQNEERRLATAQEDMERIWPQQLHRRSVNERAPSH